MSDLGQAAIYFSGSPGVFYARRVASAAWNAIVGVSVSGNTGTSTQNSAVGAGLLGSTDPIASGGALPPTTVVNFIIKI